MSHERVNSDTEAIQPSSSLDVYRKASQICSPHREAVVGPNAVLPGVISGLTNLYSEIFVKEMKESPHDMRHDRKDEIYTSCMGKAYLHLWGLYSSQNKSAVRTVASVLTAVHLLTERDKKSLHEAFDAIGRSLYYPSNGILADFIIASRQLGDVYGIDSSNWFPKAEGRFPKRMETAQRYIELSKQKREQVMNMSEEKYEYLKGIMVLQAENESDRLSYLDLYLDMNGLNEQQVKYSRNQLREKYPSLNVFDPNRLSNIARFVESILDDRNRFIQLEEGGTVTWDENTISQKYLPQEVVVDIRKRANSEAIHQLQKLKGSEWQMRYRARDIIDFYQFLLAAFNQELDQTYIVNNTSMYEIYPIVAERCMKYLQEKYKGNNLHIGWSTILHLSLLLSNLSTDHTYHLCDKTGISSIARGKRDPSADYQQEIGLQIENSIIAADLLHAHATKDYSQLSLSTSPSRFLYQFWFLHPDWSDRQMAEVLGLSFSSLTYAAKAAILHTMLSSEGRGRLLELEDQFPLRTTDFFQKLKAMPDEIRSDETDSEAQFRDAIHILSSLSGVSRLTLYLTGTAVDFLSRTKEELPFEKYVLEKVAQGYSARQICRSMGLDDLKEHDPRFLLLSEMIKILVRYPLDWTRYNSPFKRNYSPN